MPRKRNAPTINLLRHPTQLRRRRRRRRRPAHKEWLRHPLRPLPRILAQWSNPRRVPILFRDDGDRLRFHAETSKTVRRSLFILMGFSFFSLLTLSAPDRDLIATDAEILVPFADVPINFSDFLVVGPLTLIGILVYLHIFLGHLALTDPPPAEKQQPMLFNLPYRTARAISAFLFYWLAPTVLWAFARKAAFHPRSPHLVFIFFTTAISMLWLQVRRCPKKLRRTRIPALFLLLFVLLLLGADKVILFLLDRPMSSSYIAHYLGVAGTPFSELFHRRLDLRGADLRNRNLTGFDFTDADLTGADLRGSDLTGAILTGAELSGADLRRAILDPNETNDAHLNETKPSRRTGMTTEGDTWP